MYRDTQLKKFLLGQLDEDSRQELEQHLLNHDPLLDRLSALDEELIAALLDGTLPSADASALRSRLLASPQGRRTVALSLALAEKAQSLQVEASQHAAKPREAPEAQTVPRDPRSDWKRFFSGFTHQTWFPIAATAAVTALLVGTPAWLHRVQPETDPQQLETRNEASQADSASQAPLKMSFDLLPVTRSSGQVREITTPQGMTLVELWLETPYTEGLFKILVKSNDAVVLESGERPLRTGELGRFVTLELDLPSLPPGRLELELLKSQGESWEPVGLYLARFDSY